MSVLNQIVAGRRRRVAAEGPALGEPVPLTRQAPLTPFAADPLIICEIKRRSPSAGAIEPGLDGPSQAGLYAAAGVPAVSVLTEPDHFAGSLADLIAIKAAHPHLAVLRKDFLLDARDIDVSYRAGADAVLLIAAVLDAVQLRELHQAASGLGMAALVEVHDQDDVDKVRSLRPPLVGINARDLRTFRVDRGLPVALRSSIDWPCIAVYESGITRQEHAHVAFASGFGGALVGEGVIRRPQLIGELVAARRAPGGDFWRRLFARRGPRPLVKICGITNREDAELATELGADMLGLMLAASSPRRVERGFAEKLRDLPVLKVGVVVSEETEARAWLEAGLLDAVQLHGAHAPDDCYAAAFPYYKALRAADAATASTAAEYHCPRVLLDGWSPQREGGTGRRVPAAAVQAAAQLGPLWLAGGLEPDNVAEVVATYQPELVDVSSRLEDAPGSKDPALLRAFFAGLSV